MALERLQVQRVRSGVVIIGVNFRGSERYPTDGGSQFTSQLSSDLCSLLGFDHLVIVAYHSQANGLVERRNKELSNHLRSLVYEKRIRDVWSYYLPLVQRILNYTIDQRIHPGKSYLGDLTTSDLAMDVSANWSGRNVEDSLVKLREGQATLVRSTRYFLK